MAKKLIFAGVLIAAVVAFAVLLARQKPVATPSFRMADGTVVTFGGVTYGTNQTFVWGTPAQKFWYRVLPAKLKSWSRCMVQTRVMSDPITPTIWMHMSQWGTNNPGVRIIDAYGTEFDPQSYSMGTMSFDKGQLAYYQISTVAPQGKIAGIAMYEDATRTQRAGQFLLPGAALVTLPQSPAPLPEPKLADGLTFQLVGLTTGLESMPDRFGRLTNAFPFTQAAFRITRDGKPVQGWSPMTVNLKSKDGKTIRPQITHHGLREGDLILDFSESLDPAAGPWSLEVNFNQQMNFADDQLVKVAGVPFPVIGETNRPGLAATAHGVTLTVDAVYKTTIDQPVKPFMTGQPIIEVSLAPAAADAQPQRVEAKAKAKAEPEKTSAPNVQTFVQRTQATMMLRPAPTTANSPLQLVEAEDEQGKTLRRGGQKPLGNDRYALSLQNGQTAQTMDLTFAVNTSRKVEFIATPVVMATNRVTVPKP